MHNQQQPSDADCIAIYLRTMQFMCSALGEPQLSSFGATLQVRRFKAKSVVFPTGTPHREIGFVISGLVRSHYLDARREEKSAWFIPENEFVTDYPAFLTGEPSQFCFETLEPTSLVFLQKDAIYEGYDTHHAFERYGRLIAEAVIRMQQMRIESFLFKSAKERYLDFMASYPQLRTRISVTHMASFIGIERQSLTRIRKELMLAE